MIDATQPRPGGNSVTTQEQTGEPEPSLLRILQPDEELHVQARAMDGIVAVTDRRLVITTNERVAMDVAYGELRRIQFDIERGRPATFVVVPDDPSNPPEVLAIPAKEYENVGRVLALIGERIAHGG
jgi:hypothetical protein